MSSCLKQIHLVGWTDDQSTPKDVRMPSVGAVAWNRPGLTSGHYVLHLKNCERDSTVGQGHGKWLVADTSLCTTRLLGGMQGRSFYSHWTDVTGRRRLCITLFFNLFWHAKYFHFCSGSRSAEGAADCTAYCGGADEGPAFCQPDVRDGSCGTWH